MSYQQALDLTADIYDALVNALHDPINKPTLIRLLDRLQTQHTEAVSYLMTRHNLNRQHARGTLAELYQCLVDNRP